MSKQNTTKQKALINLKRAKGLIAEMIEMIRAEKPCVDLMVKNSAAVFFLRRAHEMIMENDMENCFKVVVSTKSQTKKQEKTVEILSVVKMFNR